MNKKDYLGAVTAKVFDSDAKKSVTSELEVHIDEKTDFFKEIGYNEESSEEKAIEAMGETEEVASQFGMLHNEFYNPVADIILFVIWIALLGGGYYLLKEYIFCDIGMSSVILGASCLSFSLMAGYCALSLFKNKLLPVIFSFFGIGATGIFNYFILTELDKKMGDSLQSMIDFILKAEIPKSTNYPDKNKVITIVTVLLLFAIIRFVFSLAYNIKVKLLANNRFDNKLMHMFIRLSTLIAAAALALSIFFGVKCYFDLNSIKNEYYDAYDYVIEMSEKCDTKEDIIAFVNKGEYPLKEDLDKEGNLYGYTYEHNLVCIDISFDGDDEESRYEENMGGTAETYQDQLINDALSSLDNPLDKKTVCMIHFYPVLTEFDGSYDLMSTRFLKFDEEEENSFRSYVYTKNSNESNYNFYKNAEPFSLDIRYTTSTLSRCEYEFSYIFGEGIYKHIEEKTCLKENESLKKFYEKSNRITEIVKENLSADRDEIARLTNASAQMPDNIVSREEYESRLDILGSKFKDKKEEALEYYDSLIKYIVDDNMYFVLSGNPYSAITFFGEGGVVYDIRILDDKTFMSGNSMLLENTRIRIDGVYYDKQGYCYSLSDHVPYYTADGKKYYYYCKTIEDKTNTVGNTKEYYITDRKHTFYKADNCFIDKDGYLDVNPGNLKYDEETGKFKSPSGSEYTKAYETSWDENGNLIFTE